MKRNIEKNSEKKFNYYIDVIKEFAGDTYQKFFNRYIELNNINDKNYVLPNSVLDIDDVLQDYYIKAYELLHDYYSEHKFLIQIIFWIQWTSILSYFQMQMWSC